MSKSGGTFVTLATLKEKGYDPLAYRYLCLTAHYRTQLEFTFESLDAAAKSLENLRTLSRSILTEAKGQEDASGACQTWKDKFAAAMEDDLNAPKALAVVWEGVRSAEMSAAQKLAFLRFADGILALDLFKEKKEEPLALPQEVQNLLEERARARAAKDYKKSDELRDAIAQLGYLVKDTPQGQKAEKKP